MISSQSLYERAEYCNTINPAMLSLCAETLEFTRPRVTLKFDMVEADELQDAYRVSIDFGQWLFDDSCATNPPCEIEIYFYGNPNESLVATTSLIEPQRLVPLCSWSHDVVSDRGSEPKFLISPTEFSTWKSIVVRSVFKWLPEASHGQVWRFSKYTYSPSALFPAAPFDATLQGKYPVHKEILVWRSPVFACMFGSAMRESRTNDVPLSSNDDEFPPRVINAFIALLYNDNLNIRNQTEVTKTLDAIGSAATGKKRLAVCLSPPASDAERSDDLSLPVIKYKHQGFTYHTHLADCIDVPFTLALLALVHRYQIASHVDRIERQMISTLTASNVADFYAAAVLYGLPRLANCCAVFTSNALAKAVQQQHSSHEKMANYHEDLLRLLQRNVGIVKKTLTTDASTSISSSAADESKKRKERDYDTERDDRADKDNEADDE
jgi:hypothetical protein